MGRTGVVVHDPSAPAGHLPALRAGRNSRRVRTAARLQGKIDMIKSDDRLSNEAKRKAIAELASRR